MRRVLLLTCCSIACGSGDPPAPPPRPVAVAPLHNAAPAPTLDAAVPIPHTADGIAVTIDVEALRRSKLASAQAEITRLLAAERMDAYRAALRGLLASELHTQVTDVSGTVHLTDRADVVLTVTLGSLVEATNLATLVQSQRQSPQLKQLVDRFDCIARGAQVRFDIGMTDAQLAAVLPQIRALVGAP